MNIPTSTDRSISLVAGLVLGVCLASPTRALADVTDADIRAAIESRLFDAKGVSGHTLTVEVDDGIVTLGGHARTILAEDRAVRIATMIKGVRSVVELIEVRPLHRPDEDIRRDVSDALLTDPATDSWQIAVASDGGIVTLSGTVESFAERELASKVAKGVHGVREVRTEIVVEPKTLRDDSEIEADVRQSLLWDPTVEDGGITVSVVDGVVTLSGSVGSVRELLDARANAWVSGVRHVDDDGLVIDWAARDPMRSRDRAHLFTDEDVGDAIVEAIRRDPRVSVFEPEVSVTHGVATLRGTVDNLKARRAAAQDAANTSGVWKVRNLIRVVPVARMDDDQVAAAARRALDRDAVVHDEPVAVSVVDGVARLSGAVSSYFAREQAEDVVSHVVGLTEIENSLRVDYSLPFGAYTHHDWDPVREGFAFDRPTTSTRPDREIEDEIESELWWSPLVDEYQIEVSVESGVATLTGVVESWFERRAASRNALEGGAYRVINRIRVERPRSDGT